MITHRHSLLKHVDKVMEVKKIWFYIGFLISLFYYIMGGSNTKDAESETIAET